MTGSSVAQVRLALDALAPQPWRNGGGVTRELAAFPTQAGGRDFDWRVSVADIAADGPFSRFDGVDRRIVLLSGAGVRLTAQDGRFDHVLDAPGQSFAFAGEAPVRATLLGGATRGLNVMTRRGRYRAEIAAFGGGAATVPSGGDRAGIATGHAYRSNGPIGSGDRTARPAGDDDRTGTPAGARARITLAIAGAWRIQVGRAAAVELPAGHALVMDADQDDASRSRHAVRCEAVGSTPLGLCIHVAIHAEEAR